METGYNKSTEYLKCVKCQACATLHQFPIPRRPRAFGAAKISKNLNGIIGHSCSFSGLFLTNLEHGGKLSINASCPSSVNYRFISRQNTRLIPLTQDKHALIDAEDWDKIKNRIWCAAHIGQNWYAITNELTSVGYRHIGMHRIITGAPAGMDVDHINFDGLDNRKINLRICTRGQNKCNARVPARGTSRYRGVCWHKKSGKWTASIQFNSKKYSLGYYHSESEAALAYNQAASKYFGDCAYLNLI